MTEAVISALPEVLKKHLCTLKRASTDTTHSDAMCESNIKVVNFDKIPNEFARGKGWKGVPKSNDALYITAEGKWYFIEFKNGKIEKADIYRNIYDSLIILLEWKIIPDFDFIRNNISYILVYNSTSNEKIAESQGRDQNYSYFQRLAEVEEKLFEVDKMEQYLFSETHTYTKSLFEENFVLPMEKEEGL